MIGCISIPGMPLHTWGAFSYLGCHEIDLLEFLKFHVSKIIQFHCRSKNVGTGSKALAMHEFHNLVY